MKDYCPCCKNKNSIGFWRKISMGFLSEVKCSHCNCQLKKHRTIFIIVNVASLLLFPIGVFLGIDLFQIMFATEFGLSSSYFMLGTFFGISLSILLALLMHYFLIPLVKNH